MILTSLGWHSLPHFIFAPLHGQPDVIHLLLQLQHIFASLANFLLILTLLLPRPEGPATGLLRRAKGSKGSFWLSSEFLGSGSFDNSLDKILSGGVSVANGTIPAGVPWANTIRGVLGETLRGVITPGPRDTVCGATCCS